MSSIDHMPGQKGLPFFGNFLELNSKGLKFFDDRKEEHGDAFKIKLAGIGNVAVVLGAQTNVDVLKNYGDRISLKKGIESTFKDIYPNCIMMMDGPKHKKHRSILQQAFTANAMKEYLKELPDIILRTVDDMSGQSQVKVYPHFKLLTLRMAAKIFFGIEDESLVEKINKAITPMTQAQFTIQLNIPGTTYSRALKGRKFLVETFTNMVKAKKDNPGPDLFSQLVHAKNENGETFSPQEVVDHMIFMVQASHDTTAWTLSYLTYLLSKHGDWQDKLRAEAMQIDLSQPIGMKELLGLPNSSLVFKEALRLSPSIPILVRAANEDLTINNAHIPAGTLIWVSLEMPQRDGQYWTDPEKFDPERFNKERSEHKKCPFAYLPFGAGVHFCLGNIFAELSVKLMMIALLQKFQLSVPSDYVIQLNDFPMMYPKDDLPINFQAI